MCFKNSILPENLSTFGPTDISSELTHVRARQLEGEVLTEQALSQMESLCSVAISPSIYPAAASAEASLRR